MSYGTGFAIYSGILPITRNEAGLATMAACQTTYIPTPGNVPLMSEGDESQIGLQVGARPAEEGLLGNRLADKAQLR